MHAHFLQQAIDLACQNVTRNKGGPYGAIIVKNERVVAASGNRVTANLDPTAHAEIMAIRTACQTLQDIQLNDCILYSSCEPCPMCLGAIYWARLAKVYYASNRSDAADAGFDDRFIYDEFGKQSTHRTIAMHQLCLTTSQTPFELWKNQTNKILY